MKSIMLAALLFTAAPVVAQIAPDPTGIDALDAKNGFRKYKFGTPIAELPELQKRGKDTYVNPLELNKIGEANLNALKFLAYDGKLWAVSLSTVGNANVDRLLEVLTAQYGPPQRETLTDKFWDGNTCSILWHKSTTYGAYNTSYSAAYVVIGNNALAEKQKADSTEKARKAGANDL